MWYVPTTPEQLNQNARNTIHDVLDIRITEVGPDYVRGSMPVDERTMQPFRLLHGGASVVLAESLGSTAANLCLNPQTHYAVGLDINANHIRSARGGRVTGTATAVHVGRSTQVWAIQIVDEDGRLICTSRLTMAVVEYRK